MKTKHIIDDHSTYRTYHIDGRIESNELDHIKKKVVQTNTLLSSYIRIVYNRRDAHIIMNTNFRMDTYIATGSDQ